MDVVEYIYIFCIVEDDDEYMDVVIEEETKPEVSGNIISCHQLVKPGAEFNKWEWSRNYLLMT